MNPLSSLEPRTGGQILVDALVIHGVQTVFCVPGESYLAALEALHHRADEVKTITCRHESGAANMAEAHGKLTGQPGICFVTRGPGATHASIGVHTAKQDSTPMIMFIGQCSRDTLQRETFQEVDYRQMFAPLAKWVCQIDDVARIPEMISHAMHAATSGRPGPVVVALPEDMLADKCVVADVGRYQVVQASASSANLNAFAAMFEAAERPLVVVGGSGWSSGGCRDIQRFAERNDLPVACSFRRQDILDNRDDRYAGDLSLAVNAKLAARVKQADLIIAIGTRLGEASTQGYTLIGVPRPSQRMVHVLAGADELGKVYQADLLINAGMDEFASQVADLQLQSRDRWASWRADARRDYEATADVIPMPGGVNMGDVVKQLRSRIPDDSIVTNGAGNYAVWVHRYFSYRAPKTQLAPTSGAMGYGVPAAIAAKLLYPARTVICFGGDGCFMMSAIELATAVRYKLAIVFIVVNNGMYATIRMHQERHYPANVIATELTNPDFVAFARSFGAEGALVEKTADFGPALELALGRDRPTVIEIRVDPNALTPRATLDAVRAEGLERERLAAAA